MAPCPIQGTLIFANARRFFSAAAASGIRGRGSGSSYQLSALSRQRSASSLVTPGSWILNSHPLRLAPCTLSLAPPVPAVSDQPSAISRELHALLYAGCPMPCAILAPGFWLLDSDFSSLTPCTLSLAPPEQVNQFNQPNQWN